MRIKSTVLALGLVGVALAATAFRARAVEPFASPVAERPSCEAVAEGSLRENGVRSRRAREIISRRLVDSLVSGDSAESVADEARRRASRVSQDQNWIEWAEWVATEAYKEIQGARCK